MPLDTLATIKQQVGPQTVNHYGQLPAVTVSFGLAPGASLGDVLSRVREVDDETLPEGVTGQFQGAAAAFEGALSNLAVLLVIAVLVVYIVLGILYESYIHPLTILSGLPSAAFGALLTLIVFRMDLNIYAFVGMIMLIGIVEKNAIMQIDFALEAERSGMSSEQAIYQGCLIRFRPIMMTTMAALLGAVPIALGYRRGRRSAAAAGPGRRRRVDVLAARDAVSDAGVLHLHGAAAGAPWPEQSQGAGSGSILSARTCPGIA